MPTTTSGRFGKRYNEILRFITEPTTPSEVAAHFDLDLSSVYSYLSRMVRRGDLHRPHRGIYTPTN